MGVTLGIQVIHVAGTHIIEQVTDGLSVWLMTEGIIPEEYIMLFVLLHLISLKLSYKLLEWINYWWIRGNKVPLTPEECFKKGHRITGHFTKSDISILELEQVIHKRPFLANMIILPRLFLSRWRNKLHNIAGLILSIPMRTSFWYHA